MPMPTLSFSSAGPVRASPAPGGNAGWGYLGGSGLFKGSSAGLASCNAAPRSKSNANDGQTLLVDWGETRSTTTTRTNDIARRLTEPLPNARAAIVSRFQLTRPAPPEPANDPPAATVGRSLVDVRRHTEPSNGRAAMAERERYPLARPASSKAANLRAAAIGRSLQDIRRHTEPAKAHHAAMAERFQLRRPASPKSVTVNLRTDAAGRSLADVRPKARYLAEQTNGQDTMPERFQLRRPVPSKPVNLQAASAGRSLLNRPLASKAVKSTCNGNLRRRTSLNETFPVSAADTPIPMHRAGTDVTLKSCLSSSGSLMNHTKSYSTSANNGFGGDAAAGNQRSNTNQKNEQFKTLRRVAFSQERIREYEVTLGDNPSVSSGAPVSLGWRYNPQETVSPIKQHKYNRRSTSDFRLSEHERGVSLLSHPDVSVEDLYVALQSTAISKMERKESLTEMIVERMAEQAQRRRKEREIVANFRRRRMGIVDGGLTLSASMGVISS